MGNIKNIYFDWNKAGSCQVRQYDHLSNRVVFGNAPKFENYYLLVTMKESESDEQAKEMSPIKLTSPVWLIPNSYTQMVQQIKFQICNQDANGTFEQHSAEYTINVVKSHEHEGKDIDVDPSPMYDAYKEYVDEKIQTMIAAAGDVAIDTTLSVSGAAADAKATGDAISETNERLDEYEDIFTGDVGESVQNWLEAHPEATTTVEDGSLTEAKLTDSLKLKVINGYVTPEMYGAVGDDVTDDSAAIQRMINNCPADSVCIMNKNYYCASGILVTRSVNVYMYGRCRFPNTLEYAFRVYGHGAKNNVFRLNLLCVGVEDTWKNRQIIGLDLWACQQNTFDVSITGFKTGIRLLSGNTSSEVDCDYNKIFIRTIYNCQYAIYLTGMEGESPLNAGTTSQNTFIGGRIGVQGASVNWLGEEDTDDNSYWAVRSVLKEGRTNNNNTFLGVSFEGFGPQASPYENRAKVTLDFAYGMYLNCRFEGMTELSKTVSGIIPPIVLGGYSADEIYSGGATFVGNRKIELHPYNSPVVIKRVGSGSKYLEIYNANGIKISEFDTATFYIPKVALLPNGGSYGGTTVGNSVNLLFEYTAENAVDAMPRVQAKDWRMTNFGHILSKSRNGTAFDIQPIYTSVPNNVLPGTMAFVNGKPQWYDGTQWVDATGAPVA